jgi:hypothetical protein
MFAVTVFELSFYLPYHTLVKEPIRQVYGGKGYCEV